MLQDVKSSITRGIAAGKSHKDIKSDIEQNFDFDKEKGPAWKFDRIMRTETRTASAILKFKKWKSVGFEEYQWLTVGDEKVRPAKDLSLQTVARINRETPWNNHRKRNKRIFKIDDALEGKDIFPGGSLAPGKLNISCRCRASPY